MQKVEEVARALFYDVEKWDAKSSDPWESTDKDERDAWLHVARIAIEAMRGPTPGMLAAEAGTCTTDQQQWNAALFNAMIDAALKEGE